jgi:Tfp pilus assembly protein PilF
LLFVAAFESKEAALAVPLVVGLLSLPEKRGRPWASARTWFVIGAAGLGVATLLVLAYREEKTVGIGATGTIGPVEYFIAETRMFYTYLRLLFFPFPQSLEYEFPKYVGFLPVCGIVLMVAFAWWLYRREQWRLPAMCALAFFILLSPTSTIIPSTDPAFEHRLYLPMLAFSLVAAWSLSAIPRRTTIAAALLCILAVATVRRGTVWNSDVALWEDTVRHAPGKARAWFNLGGAYLETDPEKARAPLLRALELQPDFVEALYDVGIIEQQKGNWPTALAYYERAIKNDPEYWPAWNNMGNTLFSMGQPQRAVEYFEKTLSLNPDYWPAQYNIAILHFMTGRYEDALRRLRIVLDWRPDFRDARHLMAVSFAQAGHREEADREWKKLGELNAAESRITPTMILAPSRR